MEALLISEILFSAEIPKPDQLWTVITAALTELGIVVQQS